MAVPKPLRHDRSSPRVNGESDDGFVNLTKWRVYAIIITAMRSHAHHEAKDLAPNSARASDLERTPASSSGLPGLRGSLWEDVDDRPRWTRGGARETRW
jgi:hypothetical protein